MSAKDIQLQLHTAPFLQQDLQTPRVMLDVILALVPVALASIYFFGLSALLLLLTCVIGAVGTEWFFGADPKTIKDKSALLTGILLALTLPPSLPLWMAFIGSVVAVGLGKVVWGGLGFNMFNPALVGRAFLQAAFPTAITTWVDPSKASLFSPLPGTLTMPLMKAKIDALSAATPLSKMKFGHHATSLWSLFTGNVAGSLGETSALLILLGGIYLIYRRTFDWRIPVSILATVAIFSTVLYAISPDKYPSPIFMLLSGGLLFGAIFMATDPVTCPLSPRGIWIFGIGVGVLIVLIRVFGGLPEGVMYSILLMNTVSPLIERYSQPRPFGRKKSL